MKKPETVLRECCNHWSDDTLKFLGGRLSQRLGGDLAEVLDELGQHNDLDRWLNSAKSAWELYEMLDMAQEYIEREIRKRNQEDSSSRTSVETDEDGNPVVRRKRFTKV